MKDLLDDGLADPFGIPALLLREGVEYYIKRRYDDVVHSSADLRSIAGQCWEMDDSVDGLSPTLADELSPGGPDVTVDTRLNFVFGHPFVCTLDDVVLAGPYAAGKTGEGKYVADMLGRPVTHDDLRLPLRRTLLSEWRSRVPSLDHRSTPTLRTAAVIHRASGSRNYYHWTIDHLLKLRGVECYENATGNRVELVVSEHIPEFAEEALDLLGFGEHPTIEWDGDPVRVDTLVVPSWPEPTPGNLRWIRSRMRDAVPRTDPDVDWVYVSRQNSTRGRRVANFDELSGVLNEFDVEVVRCEELSLSEQIRLFASADGVIGPHGAGLTNMIWADHLSVIELFNGTVSMPFYVMADVLGHDYTPLIGTPAGGSARGKPRDRDFTVGVDDLREALERSRSGNESSSAIRRDTGPSAQEETG